MRLTLMELIVQKSEFFLLHYILKMKNGILFWSKEQVVVVIHTNYCKCVNYLNKNVETLQDAMRINKHKL